MGVFMAEVYMCIYNWQEKKEENQASEYFCHAPFARLAPLPWELRVGSGSRVSHPAIARFAFMFPFMGPFFASPMV